MRITHAALSSLSFQKAVETKAHKQAMGGADHARSSLREGVMLRQQRTPHRSLRIKSSPVSGKIQAHHESTDILGRCSSSMMPGKVYHMDLESN